VETKEIRRLICSYGTTSVGLVSISGCMGVNQKLKPGSSRKPLNVVYVPSLELRQRSKPLARHGHVSGSSHASQSSVIDGQALTHLECGETRMIKTKNNKKNQGSASAFKGKARP
jgi:hypothetical protein